MRRVISGCAILTILIVTCTANAADTLARFNSRPGSKVRVEGTSSLHDWQMEGKVIAGYLEAGVGFPTQPAQEVKLGKVEGKVEATIPVRTLHSIESDGKPYSTKMDDRMYESVKEATSPKFLYRLTEFSIKEAAKSKDSPYMLDTTGELVVASVTNKISMPVNVLPLGGQKLKLSGTTKLKMTAFGIKPPAPSIGLGLIKTGDEVTVLFEWIVQQPAAPAAAAK